MARPKTFYTGHANMNGWVLNQPSDTRFNTPEAGAAPANSADLWGQPGAEDQGGQPGDGFRVHAHA